jgi:hypothetical protein
LQTICDGFGARRWHEAPSSEALRNVISAALRPDQGENGFEVAAFMST